jgi:NADPH:quinone reductase-like Zn-dependent oxidoreductase
MPTEVMTLRTVVTGFGSPEVLSVEEGPVPAPGPGEVAIDVTPAGVAYADVLMRRGLYPGGPTPPFTAGYDLLASVSALGPGMAGWEAGQRVVAMPRFGAYTGRIHDAAPREPKVPARRPWG